MKSSVYQVVCQQTSVLYKNGFISDEDVLNCQYDGIFHPVLYNQVKSQSTQNHTKVSKYDWKSIVMSVWIKSELEAHGLIGFFEKYPGDFGPVNALRFNDLKPKYYTAKTRFFNKDNSPKSVMDAFVVLREFYVESYIKKTETKYGLKDDQKVAIFKVLFTEVAAIKHYLEFCCRDMNDEDVYINLAQYFPDFEPLNMNCFSDDIVKSKDVINHVKRRGGNRLNMLMQSGEEDYQSIPDTDIKDPFSRYQANPEIVIGLNDSPEQVGIYEKLVCMKNSQSAQLGRNEIFRLMMQDDHYEFANFLSGAMSNTENSLSRPYFLTDWLVNNDESKDQAALRFFDRLCKELILTAKNGTSKSLLTSIDMLFLTKDPFLRKSKFWCMMMKSIANELHSTKQDKLPSEICYDLARRAWLDGGYVTAYSLIPEDQDKDVNEPSALSQLQECAECNAEDVHASFWCKIQDRLFAWFLMCVDMTRPLGSLYVKMLDWFLMRMPEDVLPSRVVRRSDPSYYLVVEDKKATEDVVMRLTQSNVIGAMIRSGFF